MLEFDTFEHSHVKFKHGDDFGSFTETVISFFSFLNIHFSNIYFYIQKFTDLKMFKYRKVLIFQDVSNCKFVTFQT